MSTALKQYQNSNKPKLKVGNILIAVLLVVGIIGGGLFALNRAGLMSFWSDSKTPTVLAETNVVQTIPTTPLVPGTTETVPLPPTQQQVTVPPKKNNQVVISLDEWVGWKPIFDANGGTTTAKGSIFDKLGLNVKLVVINDATQSSNAMIANSVIGAGYTLNRLAYLMDKFDRTNTQVVVPFLCNYSSGGDGIIAKKSIRSIEDLVGRRVAVPRHSEAQIFIHWCLDNSGLTAGQKKTVVDRMVLVNTPDEAAKVFFAGKADAAVTWQPYLDQANDPNTNTHVLLSTKQATNFILDVIVFRNDFYTANKEWVARFMDGVFQAHTLYRTEFNGVRGMPMFTGSSDQDILDMLDDAALSNYAQNMAALEPFGVGPKIFQDSLKIWGELGEAVKIGAYGEIFDTTALQLLENKYGQTTVPTITFTAEQRQQSENKAPIMTKHLTIEFEVNTAVFKDPGTAQAALGQIINQLQVIDNAIVQIEGNTSAEGPRQFNIDLSKERANTIAKYLTRAGINPSRFVVVGRGPDNPIADNHTREGKERNRRTDVMIKSADF